MTHCRVTRQKYVGNSHHFKRLGGSPCYPLPHLLSLIFCLPTLLCCILSPLFITPLPILPLYPWNINEVDDQQEGRRMTAERGGVRLTTSSDAATKIWRELSTALIYYNYPRFITQLCKFTVNSKVNLYCLAVLWYGTRAACFTELWPTF